MIQKPALQRKQEDTYVATQLDGFVYECKKQILKVHNEIPVVESARSTIFFERAQQRLQ